MHRKAARADSSSDAKHQNAASNSSSVSRVNPHSSPLYQLPLEIRRIIYSLVFGLRIMDVHRANGPCCKRPDPNALGMLSKLRRNTRKAAQELETFRNNPSLLAVASTCRELRREAMDVWYRNSMFWFYSVPCMRLFLDEIGDTNQQAIRYVGCGTRVGPQDEANKEILGLLRSFSSLRSLTIEDASCVKGTVEYRSRNKNFEELEKLWDLWKDEAHNLLRLCDQMESVVLVNMWLKVRYSDSNFLWRVQTRESRELKMNKRTEEFATFTSSVERDISKLDLRWSQVCIKDGVGAVLRIDPSKP